MADAQPTSVVFDLGGVLIDWNPRYLYRKLLNGDEAAVERFMRDVWSDAWNLGLDAGRTFAEAVPDLVAAFPDDRHLIEAYRDRWIETIGGPIPQTVAILDELHRRGVPLWAITNWSAETFPLVRDHPTYAFLRHFRIVFVSGELKLVKPEPAIFEHALGVIGGPARSCLFVDDNLGNVIGARGAGMVGHHFTGAEPLAAALRDWRLIG